MKKFKEYWQIQKNWQLIFPFLGLVGLGYSSFKLSKIFLNDENIVFGLLLSAVLFFILLKLTLFIFKKLEKKWEVSFKWEMISIFLVFAITGSSSVFIGKPLIRLMGINKENLPAFAYWTLYIILGFIFYQILLVLIGWIFGQYKFFWNFEKKMLSKIGFKRFLN